MSSIKGERKPQHKLTDLVVAEIRGRYTGEPGQQAALAREYDVAPGYISMLVRGLARREPTHQEAPRDADSLGVGS